MNPVLGLIICVCVFCISVNCIRFTFRVSDDAVDYNIRLFDYVIICIAYIAAGVSATGCLAILHFISTSIPTIGI